VIVPAGTLVTGRDLIKLAATGIDGKLSSGLRAKPTLPHNRATSRFDPGCVKTCTDQKSLESYSNKPPNHPRFDT